MQTMEKQKLTDSCSSYGTIKCSDDTPPRQPGILKRLFPFGFKQDLREIACIAISMTLTQISVFLLGSTCLIVAGHIGTLELSVVALAESVLNVTGISVMYGLVTACDTLMSNAFGSTHKEFVGVYLQRALYICSLFCFPCWAVHINSKPILVALNQDQLIAENVEHFLTLFSPGLLFACLHQVLLRYLVNQNIVLPNVIIGILANVGHIGLQCLFAFVFQWNISGVAIAQASVFFLLFLFTLLYILIWRVYVHTWNGWRVTALEDWGSFLKLGLSGFVMVAIEWWSFEFGIFSTGAIDYTSMTATAIMFTVENVFYMLPMAFGVAASVRTGQFLGNKDHIRAKNAANVTMLTSVCFGLLSVIVLLSLMTVIPYIFTNDKDVAMLVQGLLPLLAVILMIDSVTSVVCGLFRSCGRQILGAAMNFIAYFCIAIPVASVLLFVYHYNAYGFWWGILSGLVPAMIFYLLFVCFIDWKKESIKALNRLEKEKKIRDMQLKEKSELEKATSLRGIVYKRVLFVLFMMSVLIVSLSLRLTLRYYDNYVSNSTSLNNTSSMPTTNTYQIFHYSF